MFSQRDVDIMLLHVALVVLVSETFGLERGKNQTTENNNASALADRSSVVKSSSFRLGEDARLSCGDVTWTDNSILYVIWKLNLKDKDMCEIRCSIEGDYKDTCQDHKVLRNNTEHRTLLHIPNFTYSDVGNYSCETPYTGGAENILYHINIIAPPNISLRLEPSGDKMVAVCKAERASPAASIYWSLTSNHTMKTTTESDGLITVTSTVEINTPEEAQNMSCNITHPYWDQPRVVLVQNTNNSQRISQNWPVIYTTIVISVLFCLAMLIFGIKKVIHLRMKQTSSKPPPMDYVEEVEPYACYVQRVNTIYNSSREMFA